MIEDPHQSNHTGVQRVDTSISYMLVMLKFDLQLGRYSENEHSNLSHFEESNKANHLRCR